MLLSFGQFTDWVVLSRKWGLRLKALCIKQVDRTNVSCFEFTRPSNASYTTEELVHQLQITRSSFVVVHSSFLHTAAEACRRVGISSERVIILDQVSSPLHATPSHPSVPELIEDGLTQRCNFVEKRLAPGEAKMKLALLCMSSGTTGKPKVMITVL